MTRDRIFVVGATGLVGRAFLQTAVKAGHPVTALVRNPRSLPPLQPGQVQVVEGDLSREEPMAEAMARCAVVVNCAGVLSAPGGRGVFEEGNVKGPTRLVRAAAAAGVGFLVHVSSASVYATPTGAVITEDSPLEAHPERRGHYTATKLAGEQAIQTEARRCGLAVGILRPGTVYGAGADLPRGRFSLGLRAGWVLVLGNRSTPFDVNHADNLAHALLVCLQQRRSGVWNVADEPELTQGGWFKAWCQERTDCPGVLHVPFAPVVALAEVAGRILGHPDVAYRLRRTCQPYRLDAGRIRRELSWAPLLGLRQGLRRAGRDGMAGPQE